MKALAKLKEISKALDAAGIEGADKEAEYIVTSVLRIRSADLYRDDPELSHREAAAAGDMVKRRINREPLQYILGCTEFLGLKLLIGKGVLIPRPETELMAEYAIKKISSQQSAVSSQDRNRGQGSEDSSQGSGVRGQESRATGNGQRTTILDLCTGSGCLALALAREFPDAEVYGTDISETALSYAEKNAEINGINNVEFLNGHIFDPLDQDMLSDFIISNPPYIRTDDINGLQPEIRDWEPVDALDGGADGMDFYRKIIEDAGKFLKDNGILMFELGDGCADAVARMLRHAGFAQVRIENDLAGIKRIISVRKKVTGKVAQDKWTS